MNKEKIFEATKKKEIRTSGFIHIGEIIPGVLRDVEEKIMKSHKDKKVSLGTKAEERRG